MPKTQNPPGVLEDRVSPSRNVPGFSEARKPRAFPRPRNSPSKTLRPPLRGDPPGRLGKTRGSRRALPSLRPAGNGFPPVSVPCRRPSFSWRGYAIAGFRGRLIHSSCFLNVFSLFERRIAAQYENDQEFMLFSSRLVNRAVEPFALFSFL